MSTVGDLFSLPAPEPFLEDSKPIIESFLPQGWKDWVVLQDAKSDAIPDKNHLRFALPMVELVKLFVPGATYISEPRFKLLKSSLMDWPFARCFVSHPADFAKSLRPSDADYRAFTEGIRSLRHLTLSRDEINYTLKNALPPKERAENSPSLPTPETSGLRNSTFIESPAFEPLTPPSNPIEGRLAALESKLASVDSLNSKFESFSQNIMNVLRPSSLSPAREESDYDSCSESAHSSDEEPSVYDQSTEDVWAPDPPAPSVCIPSFEPSTTEAEPDIPPPPARIKDVLRKCQRFDDDSWSRVIYKDAGKRLKHGGGFMPLQVNHQFSSRGKEESDLRQSEGMLGIIQFGILAQREAFTQAQTALAAACPQAMPHFSKIFMGDDAPFRSFSQDLVQYVCGKRSEIISKRRNICLPSDPSLRIQVNKIPPSESHLFSEDRLAKCSLPPPIVRKTSSAPKRKFPLFREEGPHRAKQQRMPASNQNSYKPPVPRRDERKDYRTPFNSRSSKKRPPTNIKRS